MSTEVRILALFEEGNPVPAVDGLEGPDLDAAAYLEILQYRSSDMTQLKDTQQTIGTSRRAFKAAVAGALVVAVLAVTALVIGQTGDDALTSENLVGVWKSTDGVYLQFNEDGTYSAAWALNEVAAGTFETGTWTFDGTEFVWVTGVGNCTSGDVGRYKVELEEPDTATWELIVDPCIDRQTDLSGGPMHRISP